jgi:hypothetical protein
MPFAVLLIGAILVIVAFNNSAPALVSQLEGDIPGYFKWAAAIAAILGIGYIPGLRTPTRYLLALVLLVILLKNYTKIYAGFQSFLTGSGTPSGTGAGTPNPTASYTSTYAPGAAAPGPTVSPATTAATSFSTLGGLLRGGINFGSSLFGTGGAANPSTGANTGLGN